MPQLAPDPGLPQRDVLLDAAAVARRLASRLGDRSSGGIEHCERNRAKYRVGESLRVQYEMTIGGERCAMTARTFPRGKSERVYRQGVEHATARGPLPAMIHDAELDTVFWTFPNDRKLVNLAAFCADGAPARAELGGRWRTSRLASYAPERAATFQCRDDAGEVLAYAKLHAGDAGARGHAVAAALSISIAAARSPLRIPAALAYVESDRLLLLESIGGHHAWDLPRAGLEAAFARLGASLAELHALPVPKGVARFEHLDMPSLRADAAQLSMMLPGLREVAAPLLDALESARVIGAPAVLLHGDVNMKNWLASGSDVALIDLDSLAEGPAAADLAGAVSDLVCQGLAGRWPVGLTVDLTRQLIAGYAATRPAPSLHELRWHAAAALVSLRAARALTRVRDEWLGHTHAMLRHAQQILAGSSVYLAE